MNIKEKLIKNIQHQPLIFDEEKIINYQVKSKAWFLKLRNLICKDFEEIEKQNLDFNSTKKHNLNFNHGFKKRNWKRPGGGGGIIALMKGNVFEKVGVNVSTVYGIFPDDFKTQIPGAEISGKFWASGISVVAHMKNPKVPAAHMNTRFLLTGDGANRKFWFGGGCDLTPMTKKQDERKTFHQKLKSMCDKHNKNYYKDFKLWCDQYFYLHHRNEPRGLGGIFFDYLNNGDWDKDFNFVKDVGLTFLDIFKIIILERMKEKFSQNDLEFQLEKRGRYVEFNLLHDRGTIFGLKTGGNPEAILMSMPPLVSWK